ncbi:MAG: hypothetical protein L0G94_17700 [Brachybacterium sp.]|uniref:hypothetical protein n=1 Tax=Brachybacterium sp. TaxID=1891286 RepID=UPI002647CBD6|nr:hypothetical protein [Brachybacterium sp.]MDN5688492.1 hypothetical protein [Brachybacterium sp.]
MNTTGAMKAATYAAERREQAARTGQPLARMSETLPSLHVREKLFVWVDKGRVRTSDGPMKGHEIASVLLNTDDETDSRREIVTPTVRDLRLLVRAFTKARFDTIDQRNAVLAARRVLDVALTTPWYSSLTIITKGLSARYWAPFTDTDDLAAWARVLGVADARSTTGMGDLYRLAVRGTTTHGALTTRITAASDRITRARTFPGAINDAQAYVAMEALGGQWKALCAVDETLRPYNLAARRTVAVIPQRQAREQHIERMVVPGGSIPFRDSSTVWVVDPHSPDADLRGGKVHGFGYDQGQFILEVDPETKGTWSFRSAYGREVYLVEAPFGGSPRFTRKEPSAWEGGVPPTDPVERIVPPELSLAGMDTTPA